MGKDVIIKEGDRSRSFKNVNRLETDKKDGGVCYWVPEDERRLDTLFAFKNGVYLPDEGYYAFSDVQADVIDLGDVDITIDDLNVPHIDIDGIDITIDDIGMPEIEIDYHITTIDGETIKIACPDGEVLIVHGPDLAEPLIVDDVFKVEYDAVTGQWTITALTDCTSGGDKYVAGEVIKTWPASEEVDFHISTTLSFDLEDMGFDLDEDIDITIDDIDMDVDITGVDIDGLDIDLEIDLETLESELFELPDEIRVIHVPNKTSYQYGEEIDIDGLVVQAYRGGAVWEDKDGRYWNGYIPAHELIISHSYNSPTYNTDSDGRIWNKASEIELELEEIYHYYLADVDTRNIVGSFDTIHTIKTTITTTGIDNILIVGKEKLTDDTWYSGALAVGTCLDKNGNWKWFNQFRVYVRIIETAVSNAPEEYKEYPAFSEYDNTYEGEITNTSEQEFVYVRGLGYILSPVYWYSSPYDPPYHMGYDINIGFACIKEDYKNIVKEKDIDYSASWVVPPGSSYKIYAGGREYKTRCNVPVDYHRPPGTTDSARLLAESYYTEGVSGDKQSVSVSWPRPHDNKILSTSFDIAVEHPDDTNVGEP